MGTGRTRCRMRSIPGNFSGFFFLILFFFLPIGVFAGDATTVSAPPEQLDETSTEGPPVPAATSNAPVPLERYRFPERLSLFGQMIPLERRDVWERMDREFILSVEHISTVLM